MHLIPVIDVRHGVAVRAVAGDRENYRPLRTPFATGSDSVAVARGLFSAFAFDTLYVADLDGIEGRGRNTDLVARLQSVLPDAALWVDDGSATSDDLRPLLAFPKVSPVVGSESLITGLTAWSRVFTGAIAASAPSFPRRRERRSGLTKRDEQESWISPQEAPRSQIETVSSIQRDLGSRLRGNDGEFEDREATFDKAAILSLDFRGDEFLGPRDLLENPDLWPETVIVMTLARAGAGAGPDLAKIEAVAIRAGPRRRVYAAGGVRDLADLKAAKDAGASGALVSSARHAGTIKPGDLDGIAGL